MNLVWFCRKWKYWAKDRLVVGLFWKAACFQDMAARVVSMCLKACDFSLQPDRCSEQCDTNRLQTKSAWKEALVGFKIPGKGQNLFELEGVAAWCECPAILTWIPRGSTGWSQVKLGFRDRLSTCGSTYCKCMWHPMGPVPALTWGEATQRLGSCWTARGDEGRPGRNSVCAWERDFWQHVWAFSGSFFFSLFFLMLFELIALWLPTREHPEQTAACGKLAWEKPERSRLIRLGFGQRVLGDPFKCVDERTQH